MAASSETAPLLKQATITKARGETPNGTLQNYDTIPAADDDLVKVLGSETSFKNETIVLARYSTPLIVTYVLQYSFSFVTVIVAGRLGTSELAAASLASMTANITGLAVYEGLATSLDTLTSQAFGAGKKHMVGLHIQRMIALVLLVTVPIGAVWLCSPWILAKLVPETKVAYLAGDFLRFYLIGAPGYGVFEAVKRFTQAQGDFVGPMATALICAPLNVFWNWLLVFVSVKLAALSAPPTNMARNLSLAFAEQEWPSRYPI
jgi:MATE family multidrug resistance protein